VPAAPSWECRLPELQMAWAQLRKAGAGCRTRGPGAPDALPWQPPPHLPPLQSGNSRRGGTGSSGPARQSCLVARRRQQPTAHSPSCMHWPPTSTLAAAAILQAGTHGCSSSSCCCAHLRLRQRRHSRAVGQDCTAGWHLSARRSAPPEGYPPARRPQGSSGQQRKGWAAPRQSERHSQSAGRRRRLQGGRVWEAARL
jgi:hypothetical protein